MDIFSTPLTPAIGFLLTLVFGFWLSRLGKLYNGAIFNIHKLVALGTVIVMVMQGYRTLNNLDVQTILIVLLVIVGICIVALFASGAFLSIGNLDYRTMKTIHNIAPVLAVIAAAVVIYLLPG